MSDPEATNRQPIPKLTMKKNGDQWSIVQKLRPLRRINYREEEEEMATRDMSVGRVSEDHYVVEDIEWHKRENGNTFYFVKWLGWPPTYNSWEPACNFNDCPKIIKKYKKKVKRFKRENKCRHYIPYLDAKF